MVSSLDEFLDDDELNRWLKLEWDEKISDTNTNTTFTSRS
jgi:hypothetical protein